MLVDGVNKLGCPLRRMPSRNTFHLNTTSEPHIKVVNQPTNQSKESNVVVKASEWETNHWEALLPERVLKPRSTPVSLPKVVMDNRGEMSLKEQHHLGPRFRDEFDQESLRTNSQLHNRGQRR